MTRFITRLVPLVFTLACSGEPEQATTFSNVPPNTNTGGTDAVVPLAGSGGVDTVYTPQGGTGGSAGSTATKGGSPPEEPAGGQPSGGRGGETALPGGSSNGGTGGVEPVAGSGGSGGSPQPVETGGSGGEPISTAGSSGSGGTGGSGPKPYDPACDCRKARYECGRIPGCEETCGACKDTEVCIAYANDVPSDPTEPIGATHCFPIGSAGSCDPTKTIPSWTSVANCCQSQREGCNHPWFSCGRFMFNEIDGNKCDEICGYSTGNGSMSFTCGGQP